MAHLFAGAFIAQLCYIHRETATSPVMSVAENPGFPPDCTS